MRPPKYKQRKNIESHCIKFADHKGPHEPPCICTELDCLPASTLKYSVSMDYHRQKLHTMIKKPT